jgi:hypothetical protein
MSRLAGTYTVLADAIVTGLLCAGMSSDENATSEANSSSRRVCFDIGCSKVQHLHDAVGVGVIISVPHAVTEVGPGT